LNTIYKTPSDKLAKQIPVTLMLDRQTIDELRTACKRGGKFRDVEGAIKTAIRQFLFRSIAFACSATAVTIFPEKAESSAAREHRPPEARSRNRSGSY
jgi:hypothetical protein